MRSNYLKRCRDEGQDEYSKGIIAYFPSSIVQGNVGEEDRRVPDTDKEQEESPDKPALPEKDTHYNKRKMDDSGDDIEMIRVQSLCNMSAVELSHRQEVQGCDEHPDPPGECDGM